MTSGLLFATAIWLSACISASDGSGSASSPPICARAGFHSEFQAASDWHLPGENWRWLAAQCFAESSHRPAVVSPAGAMGICQIMPATWAEETERLRMRGAPPTDPVANIRVGAAYMARMFNIWRAPRPQSDRRRLAQASYNAGAGNIIRAQRECDGARSWDVIKTCLPAVTGRHSAETIEYVPRIAAFRMDLDLCAVPE